MRILVCVKQVPDTTEIKIDPVRNTLIRDGVPSILNPFDAYAVEAAARIKDKDPENTDITVLSMGPAAAKAVLVEGLTMTADHAYLMSDRKFGGSDTLATSYIITNGMRQIEEEHGKFDMIFCGKQAIDGDTAQVGPEIAEHLGYPQVTYGIEAEVKDNKVIVKKEVDNGYQMIEVDTPCVVTFTKPKWEPRLGTIKRLLAARRAEIKTISFDDVQETIDDTMIGLNGSPTRVKRTFVPQRNAGGIKIEGKTPEMAGRELATLLDEAKII